MTERSKTVIVVPVARPREFDESKALERALLAFWRRGYDGCSVDDLVRETGLSKQSLYNTFGDKRALFRRALAEYDERSRAALAPLASPEAGLSELRRYMEGVLELQRARRCGACFMVKTAFGPDVAEPQIRRAVDAAAGAVRAAFADVIARAVRSGELPRGTDPVSCSAYLYAVLHGLSALARTGGTGEDVAAALSHAFSTLENHGAGGTG